MNHAVLYVNGPGRAVEFYTTTLGLEVLVEMPGWEPQLKTGIAAIL